MPGKSAAAKKCFHVACARAVNAQLGPDWAKVEHGPESWTAEFLRGTPNGTNVLCLRLAEKRHVVEIVLAVKQATNDAMPRVWWEDRALHPEATGYANVLWSGPAYSSEESIVVPRNTWGIEFGRALEARLAELRSSLERWYAEAELKLAKRLA